MTIQEAYNRGLDDAENLAYDKLTRALDGIDVEPFDNSKMEELRQKILRRDLPEEYSGDIYDLAKAEIQDGYLSCEELRDILLYKAIPPQRAINLEELGIYNVLTNLMAFIYSRAKKGNSGSKNYVQMITDIKNGLTTDENVIK